MLSDFPADAYVRNEHECQSDIFDQLRHLKHNEHPFFTEETNPGIHLDYHISQKVIDFYRQGVDKADEFDRYIR